MRTSSETAMVGGSFDPVHLGHLHLIHTVARGTDIRLFLLIPVAQNNFKQDHVPAPSSDRIAMLRLASEAYRRLYPEDDIDLVVDESEIRRGGISYTSDTVEELYRNYPVKGKLHILMGDDLLSGLPRWHDYETLRRRVIFDVVRRDDASLAVPPGAEVRFIPGPPYQDSSSAIREAVKHGNLETVRSLMPEEVASYVETHRLYRA